MKNATVEQCWRYPVKSLQGTPLDGVVVEQGGVVGDRAWGFIDTESGALLSAKRAKALLDAVGSDTGVVLPDGTAWAFEQDGTDVACSEWLGRSVQLRRPRGDERLQYEMTFDPPNDAAEYYAIDAPAGSFVDLADLHILSTATLDGCARLRPDLNWDVRRFRPNLVISVDGEPFCEDEWVGRTFSIGDECRIVVNQPTVRCAMPLRAQPARAGGPALDRVPGITAALNELHPAFPNHLGAYAAVVASGPVRVGDAVVPLD